MTWNRRQPWRGVLRDKVAPTGRTPTAATAPWDKKTPASMSALVRRAPGEVWLERGSGRGDVDTNPPVMAPLSL